jgi:hypothetical protein
VRSCKVVVAKVEGMSRFYPQREGDVLIQGIATEFADARNKFGEFNGFLSVIGLHVHERNREVARALWGVYPITNWMNSSAVAGLVFVALDIR